MRVKYPARLALCCAVTVAGPTVAAHAAGYNIVYSFNGGADGLDPLSPLTDVAGTLYGTTLQGGNHLRACASAGYAVGCGVVFALSETTGEERVMHRFRGTDGAHPQAALLDVGGTLYGTTVTGGKSTTECTTGCGELFSLDVSTGVERTVHSFAGGTDGAFPQGNLIAYEGHLYGTTSGGGAGGVGTVYAVNPQTGAETVVHAFRIGSDGFAPYAGLANVGGIFYGTTYEGGSSTQCHNHGCGTVYSLDPGTGSARFLHSFGAGTDGAGPATSLIQDGSLLYGTTNNGGTTADYGTIFTVDPASGAVAVVYRFAGARGDGAVPSGDLLTVGGVLYGTTLDGGVGCRNAYPAGCGTVFAFDPATGADAILHYFAGGKDGAAPFSGLTSVGTTFYGITSIGGTSRMCSGGCGAVFKLTP